MPKGTVKVTGFGTKRNMKDRTKSHLQGVAKSRSKATPSMPKPKKKPQKK